MSDEHRHAIVRDLTLARPNFTVRDGRTFEQRFECKHYRITLIPERQMIECNDCKLMIDPFEWLMERANMETAVYMSVRDLRAERDRLQTELDGLREEVKALRIERGHLRRKKPLGNGEKDDA